MYVTTNQGKVFNWSLNKLIDSVLIVKNIVRKNKIKKDEITYKEEAIVIGIKIIKLWAWPFKK